MFTSKIFDPKRKTLLLSKDKNIPFRKMVYLQNLLLCKMYLNTVYKIKGDQNISASTEYKWCDTRMAMLQQGSFRGQQISAAARFTLDLAGFWVLNEERLAHTLVLITSLFIC